MSPVPKIFRQGVVCTRASALASLNQSKRMARIEHPEGEPTAVALDRRISAWLIGLMVLIILGGLIITLFDVMADPVAHSANSSTSLVNAHNLKVGNSYLH